MKNQLIINGADNENKERIIFEIDFALCPGDSYRYKGIDFTVKSSRRDIDSDRMIYETYGAFIPKEYSGR